jgi:hypothetical protein
MATIKDWIEATYSNLKGGVASSDSINLLAAPYTPGSGVLSLKYPLTGLQTGTKISVGLTVFHVWSVTDLTATVTAGVEGSPDVASPTGTLVRVKPRWTDWDLYGGLQSSLSSLSSPKNGLYQVKTVEFPYNTAVRGYDLGTDNVLGVMAVRYQIQGPSLSWPLMENYQWRLERNADLTDFPSGTAIRVDAGYSGRPIQVVYKCGFTQLPDPPDVTVNLSTIGLHVEAWDIPPIGSAINIQTGVDIERTRLDTQGDARKGDEVAVQSPGLATRALEKAWTDRVNEEQSRLQAMYGIRFR